MYYIYDNINNYTSDEYSTFYNKLNNKDKNKVNLLIKDSDKNATILSRVLLDKLLKYYNISYCDIEFKYNKYGKPYIDGIYFSISHSYDFVCCAVSDKNIGIDIEKIRNVDINTINFFCTDKEISYIKNSSDKYKSLFTLYCLKEAYCKMIGTGIRDIKNVEFFVNDSNISCNKDNVIIKLDYSINNYIIATVEKND